MTDAKGSDLTEQIRKFIFDKKKERGFAPQFSTIAKEFELTRPGAKYHVKKIEEVHDWPEYKRYMQ